MSAAFPVLRDRLRPWLALGRISNLPTVWSNCLAAWLIGGGGSAGRFVILCMGASSIYAAGMFLNDACDAEFDRRHRPERPIPRGEIREGTVWIAGAVLMLLGWGLLSALGRPVMLLGLLLALTVLLYDVTHKRLALSPLLMALCRYLLFLSAGAASVGGIGGETLWSALVLGGYVVGLSYVARGEATGELSRWWPLALLALPVLLAGLVNPPQTWGRSTVAMPMAFFGLWMIRCLSHLVRGGEEGSRKTVSGLLAGIVLVDLVAVMPSPASWGLVFLGLFGLALVLQRRVPAT